MIAAPSLPAEMFVLAIMWGPGPGHTLIANSPVFHGYAACAEAMPSAEAAAVIQFAGRGHVICVPKVRE